MCFYGHRPGFKQGAAALLHNRSPLPQCAHYRTHTSDPLSLDTTDQWATHRLLLTEAPACRPPEAQAPRHRLPEHAPEDRQDRHPLGVNSNQWSLPSHKPLITTPLLTPQLCLHQMRLLPLRNLPPRTCLNSYFQQAFSTTSSPARTSLKPSATT